MASAKDWMKNRKSFAVIDGKVVWAPEGQLIYSSEWVKSMGQGSDTVRGNITKSGVVKIYTGDYEKIDINSIDSAIIRELVQEAGKFSNKDVVEVYNGLNVGEVGEDWGPDEYLGRFDATAASSDLKYVL